MFLFVFCTGYRYTFAQTKQTSMKIINHVILFLVCFVATMPADAKMSPIPCNDVITHVDMHKTNEDSSLNHKVPKRDPFELSCYLVGNANTIYLSANKTVLAEIEVKNFTTGDYASYYDQISASSLSLPVYGSGNYMILVTLSNGVSYYGEFEL